VRLSVAATVPRQRFASKAATVKAFPPEVVGTPDTTPVTGSR